MSIEDACGAPATRARASFAARTPWYSAGSSSPEPKTLAEPTRDEHLARLREHQDRLAEAAKRGLTAFQSAFADAPAGIAVHEFDTSGRITRVNREELRILGYAEEEMLGRQIWEFVVMQDVSRESVQKKLAGEKDIKPFVRTFRKADGSGVAMLLFDRRLFDARGTPVGIRTAMTPIQEEPEPTR